MNQQLLFENDASLSLDKFKSDVLNGLSLPQKSIPSKYFYDHQGSYYFECICRTEEYYVTRTEISIMKDYARDMAKKIGYNCLVLEYGSGSSAKTRLLFDQLKNPSAYIPIDIYPACLERTALDFSVMYPNLEVLPLCGDFTKSFEIPQPSRAYQRKLVYFPGSTIGNFSYAEAVELLKRIYHSLNAGDLLLLGVDLKKSKRILHLAYNDREGFTASFNLNLLKRINRELNGDFVTSNFYHNAFYNDRAGRMEMHLVSLVDQEVFVSGQPFHFYKGESIHTESSYKYDLRGLEALTVSLGFNTQRVWTDRKKYFGVFLLEVSP